MPIIDPKPTAYKGITFKSRLEARWAVFFEYHPLITDCIYEPGTFEFNNGWQYTPDFRIGFAGSMFMLEVKPITPEDQVIQQLLEVAKHSDIPMLLAVGDFYSDNISIANLQLRCSPKQVLKIDKFFPGCVEAYQTAKTFRFDLPQSPPEFRIGSGAALKKNIGKLIADQRRQQRKRKQ